jgi:hypothetical protein
MDEIYDKRMLSHSGEQPEERIFPSIRDLKLSFPICIQKISKENSCEQYSKPGKNGKVIKGSEVFGSETEPVQTGKSKGYVP